MSGCVHLQVDEEEEEEGHSSSSAGTQPLASRMQGELAYSPATIGFLGPSNASLPICLSPFPSSSGHGSVPRRASSSAATLQTAIIIDHLEMDFDEVVGISRPSNEALPVRASFNSDGSAMMATGPGLCTCVVGLSSSRAPKQEERPKVSLFRPGSGPTDPQLPCGSEADR